MRPLLETPPSTHIITIMTTRTTITIMATACCGVWVSLCCSCWLWALVVGGCCCLRCWVLWGSFVLLFLLPYPPHAHPLPLHLLALFLRVRPSLPRAPLPVRGGVGHHVP